MLESKQIPAIKQLQGGVLIPYNIQEVQRENDEGQLETFYKFDRIKLDQRNLPNLTQVQKAVIGALQSDLHEYIYPEYDQASQNTILALAQKAERQGFTDIVTECGKVMDWVDSCLSHYYTQKDAIIAAANEQDVCNVNWDFVGNCPKTSDLKTLKEIRAMF